VAILVRSWNVFHGRTQPPGRRAYLEEMIRLASADEPDVLCLQEVPVWAVSKLAKWSGMAAYAVRTRRGLDAPGRWLTDLHHGLFRSALTGQANAVLVGRALDVLDRKQLVLNDRRFRREQARRLGLGLRMRLAWARERRVCQAVRIRPSDGPAIVLLNIHLSHLWDGRCAEAELGRAVRFAEQLAAASEPIVLAGDFNLPAASAGLRELVGRGFSPAGPVIDHIIVRGLPSSPLVVWPEGRRRVGRRTLSDHPPVELSVGSEA
jgi:endonuclease/exonuclease/phosphatase family metal-dependent hydrolase